jgi:hypothetical protein
MKSRRILATGLVGMSLATMALVDRFVDRPVTQSAVATNADGVGDTATSAVDSGSSLWFCAAGESADGVDTTITIMNPTGQAGTGSVTFHGNAGQTATANVSVGAYARAEVRAAETLAATGVGAIVEFNVGGLAVEQKVVRGNQTYGAPCATSTSTAWYFADGDTTLGASSVLSVLNPFGEDAVLDLSFVTERGAARPNDLQGFLVPASSMRRIDIGAYVRRRSQISTVVKARVGRVAIDQTTSPDGVRYSMVSGSPVLGSSWYFPAGRTNGVLRERYVLFNPTANDVSAQIDVVVEGGEVEPFELDVPARSRVDLVPNEESRIARDADYSVVVATDSPSLVVQRTLRASGIYRAGFATTLGSRRSATDWVVPDVVSSATRDDTIALLNPTDTPTAISLFVNSSDALSSVDSNPQPVVVAAGTVDGSAVDGKGPQPLEGAQNLLLKASSRLTVRLSDFAALSNGSLIVRSSNAEIVVERTATAIKRRGKRTDRPPYNLADASSLLVSTDTLPEAGGDSGGGTVDTGLPVDETYGADDTTPTPSVAPPSSSNTDAPTTAAAPRLANGRTFQDLPRARTFQDLSRVRTLSRFGEFFVVVQAPSSSTTTTLAATKTSVASTATSNPVAANVAVSSTTRNPTTTSAAATSSTTAPTTRPSATSVVTTTTLAAEILAAENPQPKQPQMGLGPVAKAGAYTFSAVAVPLRSPTS